MLGMRFAVLLLFGLLLAVPVMGQDETMVIDSEALESHQRPVVVFAHEQHGELIECSRCHHDYDDYGADLGSEGGLCGDCHSATADENPIALKRAFHSQCRGCHLEIRKSQPVSPPISCAGCHRKNAE